MKEKSRQTVSEKKILKISNERGKLSKNMIMSLVKMSPRRCADSLDALVKDQYLNLQNERYEITERGKAYLDEMTDRDKRGRQSRRQLTGR
jgi:predicted transcriptional regulator